MAIFKPNFINESYYRVTYNGKGIYNEFKKSISFDEWKDFKNSDACKWLPVPPDYANNTSYFTDLGFKNFKKYTLPIIKKSLDNDKIKIDKVDITDNIVYKDKYQIVTESYIEESIKLPGKLYHGSIELYDELRPTGIDFGNAFQEPGWSLFTWTNYDAAIGWAIFCLIRKLNIDNKGCKNSQTTVLSRSGYESLKSNIDNIPKKDRIFYVYTIKPELNYEFGLGHSSNTPNCITIRRDHIKPIKIDTLILDMNYIDKYCVIVDDNYEPTQKEYGRNGRLLSFLMNHDFMYQHKIRKQIKKDVESGKLQVGDDLISYMKNNDIELKSVSIFDRLHESYIEELFFNSFKIEKITYSKSFDDVKEIVDSLSKYDLNQICNGTFKNSPHVIYREVLLGDGEPVAFIEVYNLKKEFPDATGCIVVACKEKYRGMGLTRKLVQRMLRNKNFKWNHLVWETSVDNDSSIALAEQLRFKETKRTKTKVIYSIYKDIKESYIEESKDKSSYSSSYKKKSGVSFKYVDAYSSEGKKYLEDDPRWDKESIDWINTAKTGGELVVDTKNKAIAGFIFVNKSGVISPLFINPDYRGYGLSNKLVEDAINKYGGRELGVYSDNEIALNTYKRNGFKQYGTKKYKNGDEVLLMKLESFVENMRDATPEEQKNVMDSIKSISTETGVTFYDEDYIEEVSREDITSKFLEKNDTCVNLENWQANGYNILYITGLSGSGKTTLAEDLAKEFKCYRIEQDYIGVYFFRKKIEGGTRDKVLNKLAKEAPPDAIKWLKDNKDKYCVDSWGEATPIIKEFTKWFEATHEGDGNLYIINGAWIFEYDPTHFYDRPIIIKESNTFKSLIRRTGRESGHEDSLEKNIKSFIRNISFISKKSYRDAGKRARAFGKNIASNGIEESSSYNYFITNDNGNEHFNVAKYFQMIMFQELDAYMVGNHIHPRDIESDDGCYTIATYTVDNEFNRDHIFNFLNHVSNMINNSVTSKYEIRDMSNGILGVGVKPGHENEVIEDIDNKVCSNFGWSNNDLTIENIEETSGDSYILPIKSNKGILAINTHFINNIPNVIAGVGTGGILAALHAPALLSLLVGIGGITSITGQLFATDFCSLNKSKNKLDDNLLGEDVVSVDDGIVEYVTSGFADNKELNPTEPAGNFVVIKHKNATYSLYAHLKNNSIKVVAGDKVRKGQSIAKVGYSGNSKEAHLHFQMCLTNPKSVNRTSGLGMISKPIMFSNFYCQSIESNLIKGSSYMLTDKLFYNKLKEIDDSKLEYVELGYLPTIGYIKNSKPVKETTVLETSTGAKVPKNVRIYRGSTEFGLTKIEPKRNKFNRIEVEASLTFKDAFIDCLDTPSTNIDTKTYKDKVQIYIDKKDFDLATPCVIYLLENDGNWFYKSGKNFNVYRRDSAAKIIDSYEFDSAVDAMNIIGGVELYDYKTRLPLNKLLEDADDPLIADTKDNYAIIQTDNYSDLYSVPFQMKLKYGMTDEVFEKAREAQERNPELVIFTCKTMTRDEFDALFNKFKGLSEKQRKICNRLSLSIYGYNMYDMYNRISVVIDKISNTKEHEIETKVEPDLVPSSNVNETLQNYMDYIKQEATSPSRDKARVAEMLMDLHTCDDYTFTESVLVKRFVLDTISLLEDKRIDSTIDLCPYFTPEKMQSMGVYNSNENDNYYKAKSDMSSLDWYKSYCECKEIVDKESWYLTLTERYNDLLKNPTDYNRQRVLELGWNPELYPSIKTIREASEYTKQSLIESTTLNNIDLTKVDWSKYSINEAASNLLPVFIVTSYTETTFGKFIRKWTNGRYSHAAITFDTTLKELYSFNVGSNTNSLGGGLSFESLDSYIQDCKDALIKVQAIFIKPEEMRIIKSKLDEYIANYKKSHYGTDSLLNVAFNRARKTNDLSMICSEFVARLLSYANIDLANGKSTNIVTPVDLSNTLHKNVYLVYEGLAELYDAKAAEKLVNKLQRTAHYINESSMYGDKISKKLMSYINRDISPLLEARLDIDDNGDLTITDFKKIDFDSEYHHSMKLLKVYNTNGNYEGMKYELAKLWYLNSLLEDKLYNNKNIFKKDLSNYNKMRSKILNLFNTNLKLVTKQEPDFDFQSYYQTTKFYDNRITVTKSTMNGIVDITKRFLK